MQSASLRASASAAHPASDVTLSPPRKGRRLTWRPVVCARKDSKKPVNSVVWSAGRCVRERRYPIEDIGDPSRIRTCNPRSRNPLLYPVELWDRRGLHSIANMKNPLSRQVGCEPFSLFRRQILSGGTGLRSSSTQCCAPSISGVARLAPAMSHATFSPPSSIAMSPSPFSALLYVTRRSSAQGAPS
jgi:hypothetical protein